LRCVFLRGRNALAVPRLAVKSFAHILPGDDLEDAPDSGRRNIGLALRSASALDRRRARLPGASMSASFPQCKNPAAISVRPVPCPAAAAAPSAAGLPCPAGLSLLFAQRVGLARSLMLCRFLRAAPRLETAIFDAGNVGLAFGCQSGIERIGNEFAEGFESFGPVFR
jgi:hypothetical protein